MNDLAKAIGRHEEAVEKNFSPKTVGIVKFRVGLEDGTPHSMKDTATYFDVSTAWVGKATKDIADFCKEMGKKIPTPVKDAKRKKKAAPDKKELKVAVMSAKIVDGKIVVKHDDPELAAQVQSEMQEMLDSEMNGMTLDMKEGGCGNCAGCIRKKKKELGQQALALKSKAVSHAIWSFSLLLFALIVAMAVSIKSEVMSDPNIMWGYIIAGVMAVVGLRFYISGVSCKSGSQGIMESIRKF